MLQEQVWLVITSQWVNLQNLLLMQGGATSHFAYNALVGGTFSGKIDGKKWTS